MRIRSSIPAQLIVAASVILLLAAGARILKGFNPQPDPPGVWGMIGITPSDTMRLNIVNMEFGGVPPGPCNVTLKFLNGSGVVLKQQAISVKPTEAASLDLTGLEAGGGFRTEVHPVLAVPSNEPTGCSAVGSVEVFNTNSGETSLFAHPLFITLPPAAAAQ
ncbi:MAG: hypothetical protein ABSG56_28755 [Bryobacteraceae bacterium]